MVCSHLHPLHAWWQRSHQCDGGVMVPSLSLVTLSPMSCSLSLWTPPPWKIFTDALHFNPRSLSHPAIHCTVLSFLYLIAPSVQPECLHSILLASNKLSRTLFSPRSHYVAKPLNSIFYLLPIITPQIHIGKRRFSLKATHAVKTNGTVLKHFHI